MSNNIFKRLSSKKALVARFDEQEVNVYKLSGSTLLKLTKTIQKASKAIAVYFDNDKRDSRNEVIQNADGSMSQITDAAPPEVIELRLKRSDAAMEALAGLLEGDQLQTILARILKDTFRDEFDDDDSDTEVIEAITLDSLSEIFTVIKQANSKVFGLGKLMDKLAASAPKEGE